MIEVIIMTTSDELKVFDRWSLKDIQVNDPGLEKYIGLNPSIVPKTGGRLSSSQHGKRKMSIVERLITKLMVPGHRSKKHVISSGRATGKYTTHYLTVEKAFEIIEKQTKKNPIEVLVRAVENSALREEIAAYQVGGIIVRKAVVTSPQRRVDLALRTIVQSAYRNSFGKRDDMAKALANELIAASQNDSSKSTAVKEKERIEREAEGAR
jgi:small subunit ribosomal protein S7